MFGWMGGWMGGWMFGGWMLSLPVPLTRPGLFWSRFRAGFRQAFQFCPCVPRGSYEGLELKSTRCLQTHTSVSKANRMESTVCTVLQVGEDMGHPKVEVTAGRGGGARPDSSSLDLTSNGSSSRSVSKTVSEASSFYSSNHLQE